MHNNYTPIEVYRMMIKDCLASEANKIVENSTAEHAIVVVAEMILSAQNSVCGYLSAISQTLWHDNRVMEAIQHAVSVGVRIQFLISTEKPDERFINQYRSFGVTVIHSAKLPREMNFLVVDNKHIRIESDLCNSSGVAMLNCPDCAQQLSSSFEMAVGKLVATTEEKGGAQ